MEKEEKESLTPMMRQYMEIKEKHQDMVLFFRLGDFYEMFGSDAEEVSKLLNLTLTHRARTPMCGIPYHAARNYLKRLLDAGKKVAICEQLSLPDSPRELARRSVTEIFTPATVVDEEYLDSLSSSYVLAVSMDRKGAYAAWADISTGEFRVRTLQPERTFIELESLLVSISPKEIVVPDDLYFTEKGLRSVLDRSTAIITKLPSWYFSVKEGKKEAEKQFPASSLSLFGIGDRDPILSPIGALLKYIEDNTKMHLPQLRAIERITDDSFLLLDAAAVRNLELVSSLTDGRREGSLFHAINRTKTASGGRFLRDAILHPLSDRSRIERRLEWVSFFISESAERERVRSLLASSSDLERLASKASMHKLTPRDLIAIADTSVSFFSLVSEKSSYLGLADDFSSSFPSLIAFSEDILKGISRECTNIMNEGTIILPGFDAALDEARRYSDSGEEILAGYMERIRTETGIQNLKIGENRIIGAYFEVSKGQLDRIPQSFIRRQTLVGGERFTTEELEDIKARLSESREKAGAREREVFSSFLDRARELSDAIDSMGVIISRLDFLSSLAQLASEMGYTRPEMADEGEMEIEDGRHPVVESYTGRSGYTANSFSSVPSRFSLITGPNMAGKSTYLREVAIIALLAHIGSYVPASKARIPMIDRIYCRVGASDNLARGESTFLVEMTETAAILRGATRRSLVIMDEIGRGTSTQDGMSLAYAVMDHLRTLSPITLFATHYHELTMLDTSGIQLLHLAVKEERSSITFLRRVEKGAAASSYGIHVARLAGLPASVIREATLFQKRHFADYSFDSAQGDLFIDSDAVSAPSAAEEAVEEILAFDTDSSTPLEALLFISELRRKLSGT